MNEAFIPRPDIIAEVDEYPVDFLTNASDGVVAKQFPVAVDNPDEEMREAHLCTTPSESSTGLHSVDHGRKAAMLPVPESGRLITEPVNLSQRLHDCLAFVLGAL